jgi:hypothetical protein
LITDEVIEYFNLPNISSRIMILEVTKPPTEMGTMNLSAGKGGLARKADNLIYEAILQKMWGPLRLKWPYASTACYTDSYTYSHGTILTMVPLLLRLSEIYLDRR